MGSGDSGRGAGSDRVASRVESAPVKKSLIAIALIALACGKRGDPRAPIPVIPKATNDLAVVQRGSKVILTWSYPSLSTAGKTLTDLRRVIVYRTSEELPGAALPPLGPQQFTKLREKVDSIESANLPAATSGAHLQYEDTPPIHTRDGRPVRLTYAVITEGALAKSDLSNLAAIAPLDVPPPPSDVTAKPKPEGVELTWTAASSAKMFNIYRAGASDPSDELATPINPAPVKSASYTDVPAYGAFRYRVTAVASPGPPRIESEPSAVVSVTFKDLLPPPAPATLTALVETKGVRLLWDPVDVPDLNGYFVYRYQGKARILFQTVDPIPSTHFEDVSTDPGIEYVYAVTAVDKNGNESPERKSEPVLVPKTP